MAPRPIGQVLATIKAKSVRMESGCLVWTGHLTKKGYGHIRCLGPMRYVHRVIWEEANGPVPDGMSVLHKCDNRACRELDHLFLGTNDDNIADKCAKDRSGRKLDIEKVREIRALAEGGWKHTEIAKLFKINPSNVSRAVNGERWAHVK